MVQIVRRKRYPLQRRSLILDFFIFHFFPSAFHLIKFALRQSRDVYLVSDTFSVFSPSLPSLTMKISSFATAFAAAATIFLGTMTNVVNSQTATWYECDTSINYEIEWPDLPTSEEIVRIMI